MEVRVRQIGGVQFSVKTRTHTVIGDQPVECGGNDAGMTPAEQLLGALGTCVAQYAVEFLRARKLGDTGVSVRVTAEKLKQPARLGNFVVTVRCPVPLTDAQYEGLHRAVNLCPIGNSLASQARILVETPAMLTAAATG